eukprot:1161673-Pelagomonas_calceolata.AAC.7
MRPCPAARVVDICLVFEKCREGRPRNADRGVRKVEAGVYRKCKQGRTKSADKGSKVSLLVGGQVDAVTSLRLGPFHAILSAAHIHLLAIALQQWGCALACADALCSTRCPVLGPGPLVCFAVEVCLSSVYMILCVKSAHQLSIYNAM